MVARMRHHGPIVWAMMTTGMLPSELWGKWSVQRNPARIEILGTKQAGRVRAVPLIVPPVVPHVTPRYVRKQLRDARPGLVPKDCRNIYARWLEEADIPPSIIESYMGHGVSNMTERYLRRDVWPRLEDDARTLRAYLGLDNERKGLEVVR